MYLSTQLTEPSVIVLETFASFLLESFYFCMSDRVCDDACEIITESSLQVLPAPGSSWIQLVKPLEWHSLYCHREE
jgi:hypothetical protein